MTVGLAVDVTALRLIRSNRLFWRSFRGVKNKCEILLTCAHVGCSLYP